MDKVIINLSLSQAAHLYSTIVDQFQGSVPFELTLINADNRSVLKPAMEKFAEAQQALEAELVSQGLASLYQGRLWGGLTLGPDGSPVLDNKGGLLIDEDKATKFRARCSAFEQSVSDKADYPLAVFQASQLKGISVPTSLTNALVEHGLLVR